MLAWEYEGYECPSGTAPNAPMLPIIRHFNDVWRGFEGVHQRLSSSTLLSDTDFVKALLCEASPVVLEKLAVKLGNANSTHV